MTYICMQNLIKIYHVVQELRAISLTAKSHACGSCNYSYDHFFSALIDFSLTVKVVTLIITSGFIYNLVNKLFWAAQTYVHFIKS